jgi:DNA polymerase-3 subunit gamma/tau
VRMNTAFYRKYRPKTLADVVGQEIITAILRNTAIAGKPGHAYLFYGPRGTGKTTAARLFSKMLNCEKRATDLEFAKLGEPCNECGACVSIDQGNALDVVEIDAASNRGIDEIRNLKETVKTFPSSLKYKVFIIDEVHMLTTQAFNALLKTLEEPPAYAVFVLATTEYEKVPATIVSRTQRFHFKKLSLKEIVSKLERVAKAEDIAYEKEALELIAYLADGSMRDAESLFDQISSMKEGKVLTASVESILGKVDFLKISEMAGHLLSGDLQKSLEYLYQIHNEGHNLFQFNKDLTEYLRRCLSLHLNPSLEKIFDRELAETQITSLKKDAGRINVEKTVGLLKGLIDAYMHMRYNPFPLVPFELAIIEGLK